MTIGFLLLLSVGGTADLPVRGETSLSGVVAGIQAAYDKTTEWQADFSQTTRIEGFDSPIRAKGKIYIKKPGKLRWDYSEPNRHQIVVNQEKIWIYTPEQRQVIVSSFSRISDAQLPLHLLMGLGRLEKDFTLEWADPDAPLRDGFPGLNLTPVEPGTGLNRLQMEVDPETFLITRLILFEENGNQSSFEFKDIRTHSGLKNAFFVFIPPKGVEVVEAPGSGP